MMTDRQAAYARKLRKSIVLHAMNELHITIEQLHERMEELGYGSSLRKLSLPALVRLNLVLRGKQPKVYERLDAQGKLVWSLYKRSSWSYERLYGFIASRFAKSSITYLTEAEKGALIGVLKHYEQQRVPA